MQILVVAILLLAVYGILAQRKQAVIFKKDYLIVRSSKLANVKFAREEILGIHILTTALPHNAVVLNNSLYFGPISKLWTGTQPDRIVLITNASTTYVAYVEDGDEFMKRYRRWENFS